MKDFIELPDERGTQVLISLSQIATIESRHGAGAVLRFKDGTAFVTIRDYDRVLLAISMAQRGGPR